MGLMQALVEIAHLSIHAACMLMFVYSVQTPEGPQKSVCQRACDHICLPASDRAH